MFFYIAQADSIIQTIMHSCHTYGYLNSTTVLQLFKVSQLCKVYFARLIDFLAIEQQGTVLVHVMSHGKVN